uniref:Uncharacterized protein n=1 Tax=Rousettus aegyptiacus TaxID=9407 RepID=A0A7J8IM65_ROUAE|nr:hypothetical protein HJG63_010814 [Rousettus aegyptiacus]
MAASAKESHRRAGRGRGVWAGVRVRQVEVTFEINMFSRSLQPSITCPLSPEQTCPNFTLLHSGNGKHVPSLLRQLCAGLNVSPPSRELLAGGVVPDLSLSPRRPAPTGPVERPDRRDTADTGSGSPTARPGLWGGCEHGRLSSPVFW